MNWAQAIDAERVLEGIKAPSRIERPKPMPTRARAPRVRGGRGGAVLAEQLGKSLAYDVLFEVTGGGNAQAFAVLISGLVKSGEIIAHGKRGQRSFTLP